MASSVSSPDVPLVIAVSRKLPALHPILCAEEIVNRPMNKLPPVFALGQDAIKLRGLFENLSRVDSVDSHSVELRTNNLHRPRFGNKR